VRGPWATCRDYPPWAEASGQFLVLLNIELLKDQQMRVAVPAMWRSLAAARPTMDGGLGSYSCRNSAAKLGALLVRTTRPRWDRIPVLGTSTQNLITSIIAGIRCRSFDHSIPNLKTWRTSSRKLYADHGTPIRELSPWISVGTVAAIALGIPLAVLILGSSLVWAFSGFALTRK
jgi:hypothetical protein